MSGPAKGLTRFDIGAIILIFGGVALIAPLLPGANVAPRVGVLLMATAGLELFHSFRRSSDADRRAARFSAAVTMFIGLLLFNAPLFAGAALVLFIAGAFAVDGGRHLARAFGGGDPAVGAWPAAASAAGNLLVAVALFVFQDVAAEWAVAVAGAARILGTGLAVLAVPVYTAADTGDTVVRDLGVELPELQAIADRLELEEETRAPIDRGWVVAFIVTLFAIHLGRMGLDRTFLGILSPTVAVVGDILIGSLFAFGIVLPVNLASRPSTRALERRAWSWCLKGAEKPVGRLARGAVQRLLTRRLRFSIRLRAARYSLGAALSRALQIGLPFAAVFAATFPVWGMSWYFDTENWAAGVWSTWAESRTETWRQAMVEATGRSEPIDPDGSRTFAVSPPGVAGDTPYSFIVIGDTGEGDASQHVLRDQLLAVAERPEVRFVVISSDVVYPTGAMKDYEAKFWLPFKGVTKPIYAIPGNHDWFDALDGFAATFLEPRAARVALQARATVDHGLTSTTDARIDELVTEAARLRREYRVPTGFQRAPFFQIQTDDFALIAVDTGILRRLDDHQLAWLQAALGAARGKLTMAIVGHPLYAGGHNTGIGDPTFAALYDLLRAHGVAVAMAGDTHDFELYIERASPAGPHTMYHVVNGGGGAYLSFGTTLAWPSEPALPEWAHYPGREAVDDKLSEVTPWWKWPAWWWTRRMGGWPFSAEWLSAAFDVNKAPFFQSFVEVRVDPAARRLAIVPYGVHGRLTWGDLDAAGVLPTGASPTDFVEWTVTPPE